MTARRSRAARRWTAAGRLALGAALWLAGCAHIGDSPPGSSGTAREGAWLGYFSGEDLRAECGGGGPDAFRLVWRRAGGGFRVLEVVGNEAGGGVMLPYAIDAGELIHGEPPPAAPEPGRRLPLTPDGFAGLVYWFDRLGLFVPVPGAPGQPGAAREWLISGCLGGNWIFNIHLPAAGGAAAGGVPVRAIRAGREGPDSPRSVNPL